PSHLSASSPGADSRKHVLNIRCAAYHSPAPRHSSSCSASAASANPSARTTGSPSVSAASHASPAESDLADRRRAGGGRRPSTRNRRAQASTTAPSRSARTASGGLAAAEGENSARTSGGMDADSNR